MNTEKLVRMANQIAEFFNSYPGEEGVAGVRDHIHAFWTPRMVAALQERAAHDPAGLLPLAVAALLRPGNAESPAEKATAGPEELGAMASDAG